MIETIIPSSREEWLALRKSTIGASEVAALLGVHPWLTPYQLWARKSGLIPEAEETPAMRRGRILEAVAIDFLREERPEWTIMANSIPGGTLYRDPDAGLSCTPDALVLREIAGFGPCQIKSVEPHVFNRTWVPDNARAGPQAPIYVEIQAIQEATLTGASWACVGALVVWHGIDLYLIEIGLHAGIMARIRREAAEFWRRVRENDPYQPDYGRDGDVIRSLYADDSGGEIDLSSNERAIKLVAAREGLKRIEAAGGDAVKERKRIDAEIIHLLGNAARGTLADGRVIEAKTIFKKSFTVEPTVFRSIKIKQQRKSAA
jgi:YqaJ-like viral recombinase domain